MRREQSVSDFSIYMAGLTDTGMRREHNEDCLSWHEAQGLAVLADGMGGHNAGDVASSLCVESINESLLPLLEQDAAIDDITHVVAQAIHQANAHIHQVAEEDPTCKGMGTTVVLTLFHGHQVVLAHVGDSRIYRLRKNEFQAMTADHSLVRELLAQGTITAEEAVDNPFSHVITQAVGVREKVEPEVQLLDVEPGDIYLLCSDGLSDLVPEEVMAETLVAAQGNWSAAAQHLVDAANQAGGRDNISVLIAAVGPGK